MAAISLQPISKLYSHQFSQNSNLANIYMIVSMPDQLNPGNFVSKKADIESLLDTINTNIVNNIQDVINKSITDFNSTLSGTVSGALTNILSGEKVLVTDYLGKLIASNITNNELACLSGCTANITATFNVLTTNIAQLRIETNNQLSTIEKQTIPGICAEILTLSNTMPTISSDLKQLIQDKTTAVSEKLNTLTFKVDNISNDYVAKSAQLSNALIELNRKLLNLEADNETNSNNIQFILENLGIGVIIYDSIYNTELSQWINNDTTGSLFKLDDASSDEVNESMLLIGAGTPTDSGEIQDLSVALSDQTLIPNNNLSSDTDKVVKIDVETSTDAETPTIKINNTEQNIKFEQLIFLNIN